MRNKETIISLCKLIFWNEKAPCQKQGAMVLLLHAFDKSF
jgi:hypothetical protein